LGGGLTSQLHMHKLTLRGFSQKYPSGDLRLREPFRFMSPIEADEDLDLEDEEPESADYPLDNPILGAQELLCFARVKEMLQAG